MWKIKCDLIFKWIMYCLVLVLCAYLLAYSVDHFLGYHAPGAQHCEYEDI